jgi:coproporphyrinogen III oxidase
MYDAELKYFHSHVLDLQEKITDQLRSLDSSLLMKEDLWQRKDAKQGDGGGGRTRAFYDGSLFENAGVNTSLIEGAISQDFAKKLNVKADSLGAAGISLILHPKNPKVPTVHANFRMITSGDRYWFGGGADLTPYYPLEEDFHYFHGVWKEALNGTDYYPSMKKECDEYFVNHHRAGEMRGIGGIFFDHWNKGEVKEDLEFVKNLSQFFIPSYFPIAEKRKNEAYDHNDEEFMLWRRGRYVEFNLLHDRGTLFGLKTNGRVESILISLPARCNFSYTYRPKPSSPHEKMMNYYRPKDWV